MRDEIASSLRRDAEIDRKKCRWWLELSEEITSNTNSAVDVLNDFLNYDIVESGNLSLEFGIVPIFDLIEQVVSEFKRPSSKKRIALKVMTPLSSDTMASNHLSLERFVVGDKVRLTQVIRNLVSNAIKFTPEEGRILVSAKWMPPGPEEARKKPSCATFVLAHNRPIECSQIGSLLLEVVDTGIGMTPEQVAVIFNQGTKFDMNTLQGGNGSGLGTFIAKGIVQQHGGVLSASSDGLNKGSNFSVRLPLYDVPMEYRPTIPEGECTTLEESSFNEGLRILIVDDSKMNLKLLMHILTKNGHTCDGAEDGLYAVQRVQDSLQKGGKPYDCILMDFQMPIMDGPTAAKKIRELGCDSFIAGVTGNVMREDVLHFLDHGANAVLPKPIKITDLEALWMEYNVRGTTEEEEALRFQMSLSAMES
jgi:CheY-like chemotaxis protein